MFERLNFEQKILSKTIFYNKILVILMASSLSSPSLLGQLLPPLTAKETDFLNRSNWKPNPSIEEVSHHSSELMEIVSTSTPLSISDEANNYGPLSSLFQAMRPITNPNSALVATLPLVPSSN